MGVTIEIQKDTLSVQGDREDVYRSRDPYHWYSWTRKGVMP